MRRTLLPLILLLAPATQAGASVTADVWQTEGSSVRAAPADLTVPQSAGPIALVKTGELDEAGGGNDNYAQYVSEDGVIQGTIYIYRPGFADAAVSAFMTERAILERFGAGTRRTAFSAVPAGGKDAVALKALYEGGAGGALTTAAAFVHAGGWIVKLRVTGPTERIGEVTGGMNALLAGLRFDADVQLFPAKAAPIGNCPSTGGAAAQVVKSTAAPAQAGASGAFPRDGHDAMCLRGTVKVGDASFDMLQPTGSGDAGPLLIPMDDAGQVWRFDRAGDGGGYQLTRHRVGGSDAASRYDRIPNAAQIAAIIADDAATATQVAQAPAVTHMRRADRRDKAK